MSTDSKLQIEVFFDLICPWCYIGKRQFDQALAEFKRLRPDVACSVQWHAYPLIPQTPLGGVSFAEFYRRRLGGDAAVAMRQSHVLTAAFGAGVEIAFERIEMLPNTLASHRLLATAARVGQSVDDLIEDLFKGYFQRGEDIGNAAVLVDAGMRAGLTETQCASALADNNDNEAANAELLRQREQSHQRGVQGVPHFFLNGETVSGAQRSGLLLRALHHAVGETLTV